MIWNVRAIPKRHALMRRVWPVMSWPSSTIRPLVGLKKPLIKIKECGLARAVRTDQRAQFALFDRHRNIVDRHQAAEMLRHIFYFKHAHDNFLRTMPSTPRGKNNTISTKSIPMKNIQFCV